MIVNEGRSAKVLLNVFSNFYDPCSYLDNWSNSETGPLVFPLSSSPLKILISKMDSISDSRLNTSNDSLGTTTGDSVPTHSNTIHADTPRPSAYDNTSMSDKSVDEEALQDDLLATQMQATASYLSGNISPQQKAAAIAAFHAMLSVAEGESEAKPLDLTESPPKSLMKGT